MGQITNKYHVLIIGAGVVGNAIARELSRYDIDIAVLENELDVGMGASSRNSGVIHSGIHYNPGSLRASLNVQGNAMMGDLCKELKVKIKYIGKLTVAQDKDDLKMLAFLKEQGEANGQYDNHDTRRRVIETEQRKDGLCDLDNQPGCNNVGGSHAEYIAVLELVEK